VPEACAAIARRRAANAKIARLRKGAKIKPTITVAVYTKKRLQDIYYEVRRKMRDGLDPEATLREAALLAAAPKITNISFKTCGITRPGFRPAPDLAEIGNRAKRSQRRRSR
jgi:hypothetical protein